MLNNIMTMKTGLEVIQTGTIWKLGCGFLFAIVTMALSCMISEIKRGIGGIQNRDFFS